MKNMLNFLLNSVYKLFSYFNSSELCFVRETENIDGENSQNWFSFYLRPCYLNVLYFKVHKVIVGSLADKDGRIQKGDRVLSINGRSTKGVTHREALSILKVNQTSLVSHLQDITMFRKLF